MPAALKKSALVESFRREAIQRAARTVIARRGLRGASMQAIADAAGVAKGTLYLYFKDRDELIERSAEDAFSELLARLEAVLAEKRPLREGLRELIATKVEFFDRNQDFLRVYVATRYPEEPIKEAGHRRRGRPQYARYLERLAAFLEAAVARREMKRMDSARVALFLAEGVSAILLRRLGAGGPAAAEDVDWMVELMLNGMCRSRRDA